MGKPGYKHCARKCHLRSAAQFFIWDFNCVCAFGYVHAIVPSGETWAQIPRSLFASFYAWLQEDTDRAVGSIRAWDSWSVGNLACWQSNFSAHRMAIPLWQCLVAWGPGQGLAIGSSLKQPSYSVGASAPVILLGLVKCPDRINVYVK